MAAKLFTCALFVLCLTQCLSFVIIKNDESFEAQVDELLRPEFVRIDKLEERVKVCITMYKRNRLPNDVIQNVTDIMNAMLQDTRQHFIDLKEESMHTRTLPDMKKNQVGVVFLSLVLKFYTEHKNELLNADIEISDEDLKQKIKSNLIEITDLLYSFIRELRDEFAAHPDEWKVLDPIMNENMKDIAEKSDDPAVKEAYQRLVNMSKRVMARATSMYLKLARNLLEYAQKKLEEEGYNIENE